MLIIPAIDILGGRCVRLYQGDYNQVSTYDHDLHSVCTNWVEAGAKRIHLVDLDGAKAGRPINHRAIIKLAQSFPTTSFETGGGVRTMEDASLFLQAGLDFVILGSIACTNPKAALAIITRFPGQILLGLDAQDDQVKIAGWLSGTGKTCLEVLAPFMGSQVAGIVHTDIARDGTLEGANLKASARLARHSGIPVIASGGVSNMQDIERLRNYKGQLVGAIVGKALYEQRLELAEAIEAIDSHRAN